MKQVLLAAVIVLGLGLVQGTEAAPIVIKYEVTHVSGDQWLYTYHVSYVDPAVFEFQADQGFAIRFPPGAPGAELYANLAFPAGSPPPPSADWDVLLQQPDMNLPSDGLYDALALVNAPSIVGETFPVLFDWLGPAGTRPGSQLFTVYELVNGAPIDLPLGGGVTVPFSSVPEPGTLALLGLGGAALLRSVRSRRRDSKH